MAKVGGAEGGAGWGKGKQQSHYFVSDLRSLCAH